MNCIILAAGYGTRLYPLTEKMPKPLLKVGQKSIIDWLVDDIASTGSIEQFVVVSNHKFIKHYEIWAKNQSQKVCVVDDGSVSNETRLGAVKDMQLGVGSIPSDTLVVAGDNVLDFSIGGFIDFFSRKKAPCVMCHEEHRLNKQQKTAIVTFDYDMRITSFEEKPLQPKGNYAVPPFYLYRAEDIARINEALADGCGSDSPGSFAAWLSRKTDIFAYKMPGKRYDIGDSASYQAVQQEYKGIIQYT